MPGSPHGLGYLDLAAHQRTVDVLSGSATPVIWRKPEDAWAHEILG